MCAGLSGMAKCREILTLCCRFSLNCEEVELNRRKKKSKCKNIKEDEALEIKLYNIVGKKRVERTEWHPIEYCERVHRITSDSSTWSIIPVTSRWLSPLIISFILCVLALLAAERVFDGLISWITQITHRRQVLFWELFFPIEMINTWIYSLDTGKLLFN